MFRDLDHLVGGLPMCEEASRGDGHPMPNLSLFVFPMIVAPEAFSRWTMVALKGDWKSSEIKQCSQHSHIGAGGEHSSIYSES